MRTGPHTFDPYFGAHQRAYTWAEKSLSYRCSGKLAPAEEAVEKVEHWLHKVVVLEAGERPRVRKNE
jgi:hypothetical protein